jgi:hypothetical protein
VIPMKKVEAIFITSRLDTVRELLSQRCGLDIAMSRANEPHDRGQAVLLADLPGSKPLFPTCKRCLRSRRFYVRRAMRQGLMSCR